MALTLVDKLEFRNDVKADFWEFVLEHLKEHGQEVVDCPESISLGPICIHYV